MLRRRVDCLADLASMADSDYYQILGVSKSAAADEIRKAYKKIVRENHPDAKPGDKAAAERFKQATEAYEILSDEEKRAQYDRFGSAYFKGAGAAAGGGAGPRGRTQTYQWSGGQGGAPFDINDLFGGEVDLGDLFGGGGGFRGGAQARGPAKGSDLRTEATVAFQTAASGGQHELQLNRDGTVERLTVKIPAGVDDGAVIRLAGQGQPGSHGGPAGDLLLTIHVAPHPYFRRDGNNLLLDVPITPSEAALGAKVEVPTLAEGHVVVTIPAGTSSGTKLRLRGKGIVDQKTKAPGDQFVQVKIVVPHHIDSESRSLYEQIAARDTSSPRAGLW